MEELRNKYGHITFDQESLGKILQSNTGKLCEAIIGFGDYDGNGYGNKFICNAKYAASCKANSGRRVIEGHCEYGEG